MVFSLFGRKDKSVPVRKEPAASPPAPAAAVPKQVLPAPSAPRLPPSGAQEHARQVVQRINAIESEMDTAGDVALASRPLQPTLPAAANSALRSANAPGKASGLAGAGLDAPRKMQELGSLDFQPSNIPSNIPTNIPPMEAGASTLLGDSMNALAVEIEGSRIAPEIEEAAILYANNQAEAAMGLLQHVAAGENAEFTQQAWALLFDLYQVMGKQAEFESLSIDYAARFESSPPAWNEHEAPVAPVAKPTNPSMVLFPEVFDASGMKQVDAVQRAAQKGRAVTLDFAQLKRVDADGATLLRKIFAAFKKAKLELVIHHARRLLAAAEAGVEVGRRDPSDAIWQLRLEALRLLDMQQAFDDAAIDLCVTYEISPPAWEPMPAHIRSEDGGSSTTVIDSTPNVTGPAQDKFVFAGEAVGAIQNELHSLNSFAESLKEVIVDCRRLRRIDFVAAGNLMNLLVNLRQRGKALTVYEPNNLVVALFSAMGLNEVATIKTRKF